jgi:hypothetical protein
MSAWLIRVLPQVSLEIRGDAGPAEALVRSMERLGCEASILDERFALPPHHTDIPIVMGCAFAQLPKDNLASDGAKPLFYHDDVTVSLSADGCMAFVSDGRVRVELLLDGRSARCSFAHGWQPDVAFVRTFVPVLLCLLLWLRGFHYVHGALLSLPRVGTLLLLGESGAGKSTTLLGLLRHGARWFTDDMAFVGPAGTAESGLYGLPRDFHLTDNTLAAFPELQSLVVGEPRFREKSSVRVSAHLAGTQRESPLPITVVQLEPRDLSFRAQPLDQSELFLILLRSSAWGAVPGMPRTMEHHTALQQLAFRARGFRVSLQENTIGDVRALLGVISEMPPGT